MAFHEVRFPPTLSFGSIGGPRRRTDVVTLANGFEERNTPWQHSRRSYDAGAGMRSVDDLEVLLGFFEARMGQLHAFRWKDWVDCKSCKTTHEPTHGDQQIATGDGTTQEFQLIKTYHSGAQSYSRVINKPIAETIRVGLGATELQEGADFSVDPTTGVVSFVTVPPSGAAIFAGYEFDVPVRFDTDRILASVESFHAGQAPSVPVVEVRI